MAILISWRQTKPNERLAALMCEEATAYHFIRGTVRLEYGYMWPRPDGTVESYDYKCWHIRDDSTLQMDSRGAEMLPSPDGGAASGLGPGEEHEMTIQVFYPTKKALKESIGKPLRYAETSLFGPEYKSNGTFPVAGGGPKRAWFAKVTMKEGLIAGVE